MEYSYNSIQGLKGLKDVIFRVIAISHIAYIRTPLTLYIKLNIAVYRIMYAGYPWIAAIPPVNIC